MGRGAGQVVARRAVCPNVGAEALANSKGLPPSKVTPSFPLTDTLGFHQRSRPVLGHPRDTGPGTDAACLKAPRMD